jgi:transcriptional regulator of acetoin/glycerol metabolism
MNAREERERLYVQAMRARAVPLAGGLQPPAEIGDSWARCIAAGLDLSHPPRMRVVGDTQLRRRREQSELMRRLALPELETLFHQIAGSNFLLALADADGVILDLYADNRFATSHSGEDIVVGSHWSEQVAGTNGMGTALASGRTLSVHGPEHFFTRFGDSPCTASPIRDAGGSLVGVLDASSYFESRERHTQALLQMAATQVENLLFARQRDADIVLAIHPRVEFVGTLSARPARVRRRRPPRRVQPPRRGAAGRVVLRPASRSSSCSPSRSRRCWRAWTARPRSRCAMRWAACWPRRG